MENVIYRNSSKIKTLMLCIALSSSTMAAAQTKKFTIYRYSFIVKANRIANEWKTKDDVRNLYIKESGREKLVITYYAYKDEGGDCNNVFWDEGKMKVEKNKIIITTHHFQKRLDPITEWEKKTFTVSKNGEVELTEHLFKKYGQHEWKAEEE